MRIYVSYKNIPSWLVNKKSFGSWILSMDKESLKTFCDEIFLWDGDSTRKQTYASMDMQSINWLHIAMTLCGNRSWYRALTDTTSVMNITSSQTGSLSPNLRKTLVPYEGKVYGLTTPKRTLIVRHNGRVIVASDCSR